MRLVSRSLKCSEVHMRLQKTLLVAGAALGAACLARQAVRWSRWFSFRGKVVLVAGGSRGLGLVLARKLVAAGAKVAICARTAEDVERAGKELAEHGGDVFGMACDIRDPAQVETLVRRVEGLWGPIDVLLNVAGVIQVGPLDSMTLKDFHVAMDTHCFGALHTILAVLPGMRRRRWGRIVNIASIGGKQAVPHLVPYDASKFALVGLSNGLRTELAQDGILVTTACPTLMRTGSQRNATFKGRHRQEYAWFSLGGATPIVSMSAERAADQILRACQYGEAELYITNWLNPPVIATQLFPALTREVLTLINRLLPPMGGIGRQAAFGYESESFISPSPLTVLAEHAARKNNEMQPRAAVQEPTRYSRSP
jgi:NAD(P)-dependent dehydrogenase (short-subunit alcohol dehydrogenase family)